VSKEPETFIPEVIVSLNNMTFDKDTGKAILHDTLRTEIKSWVLPEQ